MVEMIDGSLMLKQQYKHGNWKRRCLEMHEKYKPLMLKRSSLNMFDLESSIGVEAYKGSYETIWRDKENKNKRLQITVIPFESMEDADEYMIGRLSVITSILPRFDKGEDDDRVIFGHSSHMLLGRERNVFWSVQNISIESVELSHCMDEVMRCVKNG